MLCGTAFGGDLTNCYILPLPATFCHMLPLLVCVVDLRSRFGDAIMRLYQILVGEVFDRFIVSKSVSSFISVNLM